MLASIIERGKEVTLERKPYLLYVIKILEKDEGYEKIRNYLRAWGTPEKKIKSKSWKIFKDLYEKDRVACGIIYDIAMGFLGDAGKIHW